MRQLFIVLVVTCAGLASCNPQQPHISPSTSSTKTLISQVDAPPTLISPSSTPQVVTQREMGTPSPTLTSLPTSTNTTIPTLPATVTPSVTPDIILSGYYNVGGCKVYRIGYFLNVDFCIDQVDVLPDKTMNFSVSWTFHLPFEPEVGFEPYYFYPHNGWFYLVDELGTKYEPIAEDYTIVDFMAYEGSYMTAVYSFKPARPSARIFSLYDTEHDTSITVQLSAPVKTHETLRLKNSTFELRYQLKYWQVTSDEQGKPVLNHSGIPNCAIREDLAPAPQGILINTLDIGGITYQIFRFFEQDWSVREYLAISGLDGIDSANPPFFRVTIPFENAQTCILDVSEVLANLQPAITVNP